MCVLHSIPQILITCIFHRLIFHGFFSQCTCHGTMQYFLLVSRAEFTIEFCYPSLRLQHTFPQRLLLRATQESENLTRDTFLFLDIFRVLLHTYFADLISACGISQQDGQWMRKSNTEARSWKHCCCGKPVLNIMCISSCLYRASTVLRHYFIIPNWCTQL